MTQKLVLACCIALVLGGLSTRSDADDRNSWPENWRQTDLGPELATLDSLLAVEQFDEVIDLTRHLLETEESNPRYEHYLQARLGLAFLRSGRPAEAVAPLELAIKASPLEVDYHRNLASALMTLGRVGRGLSEYRQAVDLEPADADLRREYGQSLTSLRSWSEAEKQLLVAARLCGDCPEVDTALADMYLRSGQDAKAVAPLTRLYAVSPVPDLRRELVGAMHRSGDVAGLVTLLDSVPAGQLDPREVRTLAEADRRLGLRTRALIWTADLPGATLLPSPTRTDPDFWATVSMNLLDGGELAPSLRAMDRALALAPDNVVFLNNKVVILQRLGRDEEARELWERVLVLDPSLGDKQP